uniref:Uncharacterized protein n=1 Tax=Rhizophora mucronata TaxID=61149 RepID=A0A2P2PC87_RHIMU
MFVVKLLHSAWGMMQMEEVPCFLPFLWVNGTMLALVCLEAPSA